MACVITITADFNEQFSKPIPIASIAFGLGWGDCLTLILICLESIAVSTLLCGFYFKYARVYEKLYKGKKADGEKKKKKKGRRGRR